MGIYRAEQAVLFQNNRFINTRYTFFEGRYVETVLEQKRQRRQEVAFKSMEHRPAQNKTNHCS
jgi:hypothetical protein